MNSTYSKCRITVSSGIETTLTIVSNVRGESGYDYGIIGLLDTALASSYTADNSYTAKITNAATSTYTTTTLTIPGDNAEHFVEIKYRKDGSVHTTQDRMRFTYFIGGNT
jgi:hypothetical protein